jgi:hypothetical protein
MGGYTRVLHSRVPDDIHHLVPTVLVAPLPEGIDRGYGPMHRPWAFSQWLSWTKITEEFILMTEPDHIFIMQPALVATPSSPASFPFWYIDCRRQAYARQCMKPSFNEKQVQPDFVPTVRPLHTNTRVWDVSLDSLHHSFLNFRGRISDEPVLVI